MLLWFVQSDFLALVCRNGKQKYTKQFATSALCGSVSSVPASERAPLNQSDMNVNVNVNTGRLLVTRTGSNSNLSPNHCYQNNKAKSSVRVHVNVKVRKKMNDVGLLCASAPLLRDERNVAHNGTSCLDSEFWLAAFLSLFLFDFHHGISCNFPQFFNFSSLSSCFFYSFVASKKLTAKFYKISFWRTKNYSGKNEI